jgi:hypothetical protein
MVRIDAEIDEILGLGLSRGRFLTEAYFTYGHLAKRLCVIGSMRATRKRDGRNALGTRRCLEHCKGVCVFFACRGEVSMGSREGEKAGDLRGFPPTPGGEHLKSDWGRGPGVVPRGSGSAAGG